MNFDKREFRNALGGYATGVAVITTRRADDHMIVVAAVEHLIHRVRDPLLFCGGKFSVPEADANAAAPKAAAARAG